MPGQPLYPISGSAAAPPPATPVPVAPTTDVIVVLCIAGAIIAGLLVIVIIKWKKCCFRRRIASTEQPPAGSPPTGNLVEEEKKDEPSTTTNEGNQLPQGNGNFQEEKRDEPSTTTNEGDQRPQGNENLQIIKNCDLEEIHELGSGTFGTVFLGKWRGTNVAIKRIHNCFLGDASDASKRDEFWNEVGKLASLHHPNVVAFYGVVLDGPGIATVTEYVADGSLRQVLQENRKMFDMRRRILVAMDVAISMEYLHEKKIVHFDLKSENLLLNLRDPRHPVCKVCDLGLSKIKCRTFVSGGMRGTLPWMAPELMDGKLVSEKVDVYSFGIVMWELLTGKEPYADLPYGIILGGIASNTLRPEVPEACEPWWRSLMEQCWSTEPWERPTFTEIAKRLRAVAYAPAKA